MSKFGIESADELGILKSTRQVLAQSEQVEINIQALPEAIKIVEGHLKNHPIVPKQISTSKGYEQQAQRILVEGAANFCFWAEPGRERWTMKSKTGTALSGTFGMQAAISRALEEGIPLLNANYLSKMTFYDILHIFRSSNGEEIPMIWERFLNWQEVGSHLREDYSGKFSHLIEAAGDDAISLVELLAEELPSFDDKSANAKYGEVPFYKRAQLVVGDLSRLAGPGVPHLYGAEELTALADYKIPQVLRHLGVIHYSNTLADKVDRQELIPADSDEEIEIRSAAIWGVELLRQRLGAETAALDVDHALWYASQDQRGLAPYHRTYTIFY